MWACVPSGKEVFARILGASTGRGSPRNGHTPPPVATPRIRLHVGLCTVGDGSLLRGKEGSVTICLGWPARTPLLFGRGRGWGGVRKSISPKGRIGSHVTITLAYSERSSRRGGIGGAHNHIRGGGIDQDCGGKCGRPRGVIGCG